MAAKKKPIEALDAAALGLDAAAARPEGHGHGHGAAAGPRPPVRMIEGDAAAQAKELIRLLHEEAKVI